jgi:predicted RNase H-like HicB family nuclease
MKKFQEYPTSVFWDERDEGFIAIAPDLPGCSAFGETKEEALRELDSSIEGWVSAALAAGEPLPEPSRAPRPNSYSGKVLLRMPSSLHERLAKEAASEGVSLNQWMVVRLAVQSPLQQAFAVPAVTMNIRDTIEIDERLVQVGGSNRGLLTYPETDGPTFYAQYPTKTVSTKGFVTSEPRISNPKP